MGKAFKPENYNSVSPYFVVNGAQKMIDFLKELFNATEKRRYDNPDGTVMHAELLLDDTIIMIGDSGDRFPPTKHMLHVYVPDVDATYKKALKLGCTSLQEPMVKGDPDKRGGFSDFAGNEWYVSTQQE